MLKNISFFVCCLFVMNTVHAQKPIKNSAKVKVVIPKLKSSIGTRADSVEISVDEGLRLVTLPIKITDDKNNTYTLSSYQCIYRRKAVTEDEKTGKVTPISSMVANTFKVTPLPNIWQKIITEQLKVGEELYFFDIVAKNASGKLFFAPNIKLMIK